MISTNVMVLGKSGVGKSSLINYLYGENIREKAAGAPQTGKGFYKAYIQLDNLEVCIYDSWGIEATKADEWLGFLETKLEAHDSSVRIKDWIHTVFYCFSVQSARIEDYEIDRVIKGLLEVNKKVIIVLTHADVALAEEKIAGMKAALVSELNILEEDIIAVANERKTLLSGKVVEPFGRNQMIDKIRDKLWEDICGRLPSMIYYATLESITSWQTNCEKLVRSKIKYSNRNRAVKQVVEGINNDLEGRLKSIEAMTIFYQTEVLSYYYEFVKSLYPREFDIRFDFYDAFMAEKVEHKLSNKEIWTDVITGFMLERVPILNIFIIRRFTKEARNKIMDKVNGTSEGIMERAIDYLVELQKKLQDNPIEVYLLES